MLELRPKSFLRDGQTYGMNRRAFTYDVLGLPEGHTIEIGENRRKWQIRRAISDGLYGDWVGEFATPEEALASLT